MKNRKSVNLVKRLINNRISREELEEFLDGLDDEASAKEYEAYLKSHFEEIMEEYTSRFKNQKNKEASK